MRRDIVAEKEIDETAKKVQDWLVDEGLFREEIKNPKNAYFRYNYEFPKKNGIPYDVYQPKGLTKGILLTTQLRISPENKKAFGEVKKGDREAFLWDLRFGLIDKVEFHILADNENPKGIQLSEVIYYEELSRDTLLRKIEHIHRSSIFVVWKYKQRFGKVSEENTSSMYA